MSKSSTSFESIYAGLNTDDGQGTKGKGTVSVNQDTDGSYTVRRQTDAGLDDIYSYDPKTNHFDVIESDIFKDFFSGDAGERQKKWLDTSIKGDIFKTAKNNIPTSGSLNGNNFEAGVFSDLGSLPGYQSLSNGTFNYSLDLNPDDINTTFSVPSAPLNGFADANFFDNDLDMFTNAPEGIDTGFSNPNLNGKVNPKARATDLQKGKVMFYPESMPDVGYDFIRFTSFKYQAAGLDYIGRKSAESRLYKEKINEIMLPMLPNISESNTVSWGGDRANALQLALGNRAMQAIQGIGNLSLEQIKNAFSGSIEDINRMMNDPRTGPAISAYFAGQAVGANIFSRATGTVLNPNLELLFEGPTLRTFNFNFRLTPRTDSESKIVKSIIKSFKKNMAAQRSTSDLFLVAPNIYKIEYMYGGLDSEASLHPFMNKIKPCALRSFNVNYGPDGAYMTYPDGSMTCYEIQLQFGELEPIYADEIKQDDDNMSY